MPVARYCQKNIMCTRGHTDEERAYFAARGPKKVRKTGQPLQSGYTMYSGAQVLLAHNVAELFCPTCYKTGHHMNKCPE